MAAWTPPPIFYAYDAECPNCFDLNALPMRSYPLTVTGDGGGLLWAL